MFNFSNVINDFHVCVVTYFWLFCWRNGYKRLRKVNDAGSLKKLEVIEFENKIILAETRRIVIFFSKWRTLLKKLPQLQLFINGVNLLTVNMPRLSLTTLWIITETKNPLIVMLQVVMASSLKRTRQVALSVPIWHVTNLGFSILYIGNTCRKQNVSIYNEKSQSGRWWNGDLYTFRQ